MGIEQFRQSFAPRRATARIIADQSFIARAIEADHVLQAAMADLDALVDIDLLAARDEARDALHDAQTPADDDSIAGRDDDLIAARKVTLAAYEDAVSREIAGKVDELREAVVAAEAAVRDAETEFVFESIGGQQWLDAVAQHPPTEADQRRGLDHDPSTFPPIALALSCVEPGLSEDDGRWLKQNLDLAEWKKLWDACLEANRGVSSRPKSESATALRLWSALSSITAAPEASLEAFS
jgi:hypothetical protein